jgi:Ca2+-binding EF-hand superfamily protein
MYSTSSLFLIAAFSLVSSTLPQASSPMLPIDAAVDVQSTFEQDFASFDRDDDGQLSRAETRNAKWLNRYFDEIDTDQNNQLSKSEIYSYGMRLRKEQASNFDERFRSADKNGDHALTRQEAEAGQMTHVVLRFESIDANGDGKVTMEELRAYLKRHIQTGPMV